MTRASTNGTARARLPETVWGLNLTSVNSNGAANAWVIAFTSTASGANDPLVFSCFAMAGPTSHYEPPRRSLAPSCTSIVYVSPCKRQAQLGPAAPASRVARRAPCSPALLRHFHLADEERTPLLPVRLHPTRQRHPLSLHRRLATRPREALSLRSRLRRPIDDEDQLHGVRRARHVLQVLVQVPLAAHLLQVRRRVRAGHADRHEPVARLQADAVAQARPQH